LRILAEGRIVRASQNAVELRVLVFAFGVSLAAGVLFGMVPALVSGQAALAMLVLVGAALLTRSLARLTGVDPGFQVEHVLTARVALPGSYSTPAQSAAFYQQLVARMAAKPGVTAVATADATPLQSSYGHTRFAVDGEPTPEAGRYPVACIRNESPNYFEVEHVPLMAARGFTDQDATGAPGAPVVVNEALARRFFHGKAVGRSVILGVMDPKQSRFPIVGVVANTLESGLDAPPEPTIYFAGYSGSGNSAVVVIHTVGEPLAMAGVLRREVAALESQAPVSEVRTMEQIVDKSLAGRKFSAILISMFGALALALAGALVGAVAAAFAGKAIASHLYGLRASDPASFAWAAAMLLAVAMIGAWIPARRATRVDPVVALREE
jgi:putative ABC transport system permease protein